MDAATKSLWLSKVANHWFRLILGTYIPKGKKLSWEKKDWRLRRES